MAGLDGSGGAVVHRTARVQVRATPAQQRRLYGLLVAGGDVWAACVDWLRYQRQSGVWPDTRYATLTGQLVGCDLGGLAVGPARSVLRRFSDACAETTRRKRRGEHARYPRRKRRLFPVRWDSTVLTVDDDGTRVRLSAAKGHPPLVVRLARAVPYPPDRVRSVTLVADEGRLWLDVTAAVPVAEPGLDPQRVAGVDIGLIHPYAAAGPDGDGLLVSGRAVRAESRLHLEDTKRRRQRAAAKAPKRGQRGSRRWAKHRRAQRKAEATHRRRVRQAHHEAAKHVVEWAVGQRVGTIRVGDLGTILDAPAGPAHRWRTREWRHSHLLRVLRDKAEAAGIRVEVVDERGTSSTCPGCASRQRANGRRFTCSTCGLSGHRDLVGAANIARRAPGGQAGAAPPTPAVTTAGPPSVVEHRRAGRHLPGVAGSRRDRRRHLWDDRRRRRAVLPGSGPPPPSAGESHAPPPAGVDRDVSAGPTPPR